MLNHPANILPCRKGQSGSALIMALLVLLVMSIVVMGMATDSDLDLKISRNLQQKNEAFNNAETGIALATEVLRNTVVECWGDNGDENSLEKSAVILDSNYRLAVNSVFGNICSLDVGDEPLELEVYYEDGDKEKLLAKVLLTVFYRENDNINRKRGFNLHSSGIEKDNTELNVEKNILTERVIDPSFLVGIASDGNITINGAPTMTGSLHANGGIVQNGEGSIEGNVTAVDNVDIDSLVDESKHIVDFGPEYYMDLPQITEDDFDYWESIADNIYSGNQTINEDISGKVVFVDGDLTLAKSTIVSNATIVATGDITFRGESSWSDEGMDTAIIAGGDITFNGSGDSWGIFWCNGDFTRQGSSFVHGSIVAGKGVEDPDIEFNGTFEFEHFEDINNDFLPRVVKVKSNSWTSLSLL